MFLTGFEPVTLRFLYYFAEVPLIQSGMPLSLFLIFAETALIVKKG